jgi:hypothetical protein
MRTRAMVVAAVLALPPSAGAMEVAGVNFPRTVEAGGKTLTLNGAGLRTRFMFKVYAIGLYLEHPATDAATILAADEVRRAELHMLRSVSASEMGDAIADAFNANAGSAGPQLKDRLDRRWEGSGHRPRQGLRGRALQRLDRRVARRHVAQAGAARGIELIRPAARSVASHCRHREHRRAPGPRPRRAHGVRGLAFRLPYRPGEFHARTRADRRRCPGRLPGRGAQADRRDSRVPRRRVAVRHRHGVLRGRDQRARRGGGRCGRRLPRRHAATRDAVVAARGGAGVPHRRGLAGLGLFDSAYTRALVDIGHRDASERIDEIEGLLRAGRAARARTKGKSTPDRDASGARAAG